MVHIGKKLSVASFHCLAKQITFVCQAKAAIELENAQGMIVGL